MHEDQTTLAQLFLCQECHREWTDVQERWRLYVMPDDSDETLMYCPVCADREFGD